MHLKSLTLKGFKSFPDRTRLDFGPGVSVVVGPNGSGKSNITDAVLWAMGEQSPLAVRGSSMQDVIFGGGRGVQARSSAEVEIVLDNSDGTVALPLSEISIMRSLHRSGEGEYRLNGARCRLVDVIEVLSDTGLGKETHSVISQGRVEAIVTSKPYDRRLLIEEAAGLGKHRKRRRRAQLKLERTQGNLDRALDVEREARSRLRPLKRQAEAAELHARLEHQMLEARLQLAREALRVRRAEFADAETAVQAARAARAEVEAGLQRVVERRALAERALAERSERHDELSRRALHAGTAAERLQLRHEQAVTGAADLAQRLVRLEREIEQLAPVVVGDGGEEGLDAEGAQRIEALEQQLAELERERECQLQEELSDLERQRAAAAAEVAELDTARADAREAREQADERAEQAREALRDTERAVDSARRDAARVGSELAAVNQFLRHHSAPLGGALRNAAGDPPLALSDELRVQPGYELALAAALGARLDAVLVPDLAHAAALLDHAGPDGATALLAEPGSSAEGGVAGGMAVMEGAVSCGASAGDDSRSPAPPVPEARLLLELVDGPPAVLALASRLLADAWVLERLEKLPDDFAGIAVTPRGRVWFAATGEVRQIAEGGSERVLARRNERERLIVAVERAAAAEHQARTAAERAQQEAHAAELAREEADGALREALRDHAETRERERHTAWLIEQRSAAPEQGPLAVRRAQLEGELAAERRTADRLAAERAERVERLERLRAIHAADTTLAPLADRLASALRIAGEAVAASAAELRSELDSHREAGEQMAAELRACAAEETELQVRLRVAGEAVTAAEVAAQRLRDHTEEAVLELREIRGRLELEGDEGDPEPLDAEQVAALTVRVERLRRRREQLGPVNPLAEEEYAEALAHVEELEARRADLESALRELRALIRDTDRQIHETFRATFDAAARNFAELAGDLFPGGGGQLRLVKDALAPRQVLGGQLTETGMLTESGTSAEGACPPASAKRVSTESVGGERPPALVPDGGADAARAGGADGKGGGGKEGGSRPLTGADGAPEEDGGLESLDEGRSEIGQHGVEIEITPAGKSTKRLSLLSGGEKSMTALAFLFAVFLARPCPFYILDEVEAALDDLNLERFLALLRRYAGRAQFIVITHQKRTMEAADWLYGVSMAGNGVSKVLSRRLPPAAEVPRAGDAGAATSEIETAPKTHTVAETQTAAEAELVPEMARVA
ncbi:MAG TPA: AAA family ATPase [Solirubrobacteraceae bacterium]|jgi:chromosome segregation protein|nr:AAA family ATPase [Solirubrobacteraceae bacterium]